MAINLQACTISNTVGVEHADFVLGTNIIISLKGNSFQDLLSLNG